MKTSSQSLISLISLLIIVLAVNLTHAREIDEWEDQDTTLVGRISHLEGRLSRYNQQTDDWEDTTRDAPFGMDDLLYSESGSKAEIIMPNNTWVRVWGDTRLQLGTLVAEKTELDISYGKARLYNKSESTRLHAITPFGRILAPPGAVFDLSVGDDGVEITAVKNNVGFIHSASADRHQVRSDGSALFADLGRVTPTRGVQDHAWQRWNQEMDTLWASRMRSRGGSASHLPPELHTESYPLDSHGVWERVHYEGAYYRFWRPVRVHARWAPFTSGVWSVWHGEHVWIPHEPFGYVTHHYGNWVFTAGFWYWAPPVTRVMVRTHRSYLRIGFGWYPGRVAWIHHGAHLGWIPLAPHEPYYTHRHWGRRSIVVTHIHTHRHRPHRYRHHKHAFVIHRSHLYRPAGYRKVRARNIAHTRIRKDFRSTPTLSRTLIKERRAVSRIKDRHGLSQRRRPSHRSPASVTHDRRKHKDKANIRHRNQQRPREKRQLDRNVTTSRPSGLRKDTRKRGREGQRIKAPRPANRHRPETDNRMNRQRKGDNSHKSSITPRTPRRPTKTPPRTKNQGRDQDRQVRKKRTEPRPEGIQQNRRQRHDRRQWVERKSATEVKRQTQNVRSESNSQRNRRSSRPVSPAVRHTKKEKQNRAANIERTQRKGRMSTARPDSAGKPSVNAPRKNSVSRSPRTPSYNHRHSTAAGRPSRHTGKSSISNQRPQRQSGYSKQNRSPRAGGASGRHPASSRGRHQERR